MSWFMSPYDREFEELAKERKEAYRQGYDKANDEWLDRIDKIRSEIETKYGQCSLIEYHVSCDGYASTNDMGDVADMLQIIDKYKAETEET